MTSAFFAALAALAIAAPATAAVHKCVEKNGDTTWTDKPCTVYQDAARPDTPAEATPETAFVAPEPQVAASQVSPPEPAPSPRQEQPLSKERQAQFEEEQQQALEAEFRDRLKRKAPMLGLGAVLLLAGWIMHVVAAAKLGKTAWAIGLFLFCPFSNVPFTVLNWQKARAGFFVLIAGGAMTIGAYVSVFTGLVR